MAKAGPEEFDRVRGFVNVMEALFEDRYFFSTEECWRDWDDDDEDKKALLEIERDLRECEGDPVDNRLVLFAFIKRKWCKSNFSGSFGRIIMDAEVLIDNMCDPGLDYLEYKPEIKVAIDEYNEKHGNKKEE